MEVFLPGMKHGDEEYFDSLQELNARIKAGFDFDIDMSLWIGEK